MSYLLERGNFGIVKFEQFPGQEKGEEFYNIIDKRNEVEVGNILVDSNDKTVYFRSERNNEWWLGIPEMNDVTNIMYMLYEQKGWIE